jgi:hypothetical protein
MQFTSIVSKLSATGANTTTVYRYLCTASSAHAVQESIYRSWHKVSRDPILDQYKQQHEQILSPSPPSFRPWQPTMRVHAVGWICPVLLSSISHHASEQPESHSLALPAANRVPRLLSQLLLCAPLALSAVSVSSKAGPGCDTPPLLLLHVLLVLAACKSFHSSVLLSL